MSEAGAGQAVVARFRGAVKCTVPPGAPLLTLSGTSFEGEPLSVTFAADPPQGLPGALESPGVEHIAPGAYLIREGARQWPVAARSMHLHRELPGFYSVIKPRVPPWKRRLLWALLLGLAARPAGLALLRRLRGRQHS